MFVTKLFLCFSYVAVVAIVIKGDSATEEDTQPEGGLGENSTFRPAVRTDDLTANDKKKSQHLRVEPCKDGVFEVVDNAPHSVITCVNATGKPPNGHLSWKWTLTARNKAVINIADCRSYGMCTTYVPFVTALQTPDRNASELSFSTTIQRYDTEQGTFFNGAALFGNGTISCQNPNYLGDKVTAPIADCTTDFVRPVDSASCNATFVTNTSQWSVTAHCDVTRMYSAMGRYTCRLISLLGDEASEMGPVTKMTTTPIQRGRYVRGSCDITSPLPSTNGQHRYFVEITPGWKKFEPRFTGSKLIRKPTEVTLTHDCPQRVLKGELVSCTCIASDSGNPPGQLVWAADTLFEEPAKRDDDWRHLACRLMWNGTTIKTLSFMVEVFRPPSSPQTHNCPEYVIAGSDVSCDCVTDDLGNPPATLKWANTNSSVLVVRDVKRDDIGNKTFTCRMTWNGTHMGTVQYTVAMIPANDTLHPDRHFVEPIEQPADNETLQRHGPIVTPDFLPADNASLQQQGQFVAPVVPLVDNNTLQEHGHFITPVSRPVPVECETFGPTYVQGVATGVCIGLALLLLILLLIVLILRRRGWVLPCAPVSRGSKDKDIRDARRQSAPNGEPRRPSQSGRVPTATGLAFSSNVYDQFDRSQMGARSPYEALKTQPKPAKRNKKQPEQKYPADEYQGTHEPLATNGQTNSAFVPADNSARHESVRMQQRR